MELTKEEFDLKFKEGLENFIAGMAEDSEVDLNKFYYMACFLENLSFFSPVLYGLIEKGKK